MCQGRSGLSELLCLSRRANKERVATARPGAKIINQLSSLIHGVVPVKHLNPPIPVFLCTFAKNYR